MDTNSWASVLVHAFFATTVAFSFLDGELDFDTKTPYPEDRFASDDSIWDLDDQCGCKAVHVNGIIRHGTRFPSIPQLEKFESLRRKLQTLSEAVGNANNRWVVSWGIPKELSRDTAKLLAPKGVREQFNLAKRIHRRLPKLFADGYSSRFYNLASTDFERTARSAAAFGVGLFHGFGNLTDCHVDAVPVNRTRSDLDTVIRFFALCEAYKHRVKNNKSALSERELFGNGAEMKSVTKDISMKLTGNKSEDILLPADVIQMYRACGHESVFSAKGDSQFCSLFDQEQWEIVKYTMELKNYWKRSYGHDINWRMSCPLLRQIYHELRNNSGVKGSFRFCHAETIFPLEATLKLLKPEEDLLASNFASQKHRKFRSSKIAPMTGNILFVLYDCQQATKKECKGNASSSLFVKVFLNEEEREIPGCTKSTGLCSLDDFDNLFHDMLYNCQFEEMCKWEDATSGYKDKDEL